jgi:polyisoprenoid-binding protein YceI
MFRPSRASVAVALLAATLSAAGLVHAAEPEEAVRLDSERSRVDFKVKVLWLVGVEGRFGKVHGIVQVDRFRSQLRVDARIDVDAIRMNSKNYENWVKSPEFFDAERHPQIEFTSDPIPQERLRKGGELRGALTVRGIRKQVSFQMRPSSCDKPAYDCPIEVDGTIRRSDFEMRSRRGTLSDKVELAFSVYALPAHR